MASVHDAGLRVEPGVIPLRLDAVEMSDLEWLDCARTGFAGDSPESPAISFAEWIEIQGRAIRRKGSPEARWLADQLDQLASTARFLHASTPADFDARLEIEEETRLSRVRLEGAEIAERQLALATDWVCGGHL